MKELNEKEKNILTIIVALGVLVVFLGASLIGKYFDAKKEKEESMKTVLVTDNSRYFTVLGCADKFISYLKEGDAESLLLLLEEEYKDSFGVNVGNVKNFLPALDKDSMYEYVGEEMFQHRVSEKVVEYYLKGKIKKSILDEQSTFKRYDLTVILYEDKFLFAVKPGIGDAEL